MEPEENMQVIKETEDPHDTDFLGATLPPEDLQALEKAEHERIEEFTRQHPFRLDTKGERLFPGKYSWSNL
jgi:hypothetical protein